MPNNGIPMHARVRIVDAKDIVGVVTARTEFGDGTIGWDVTYWSSGERRTIGCEERELEVLP